MLKITIVGRLPWGSGTQRENSKRVSNRKKGMEERCNEKALIVPFQAVGLSCGGAVATRLACLRGSDRRARCGFALA